MHWPDQANCLNRLYTYSMWIFTNYNLKNLMLIQFKNILNLFFSIWKNIGDITTIYCNDLTAWPCPMLKTWPTLPTKDLTNHVSIWMTWPTNSTKDLTNHVCIHVLKTWHYNFIYIISIFFLILNLWVQ